MGGRPLPRPVPAEQGGEPRVRLRQALLELCSELGGVEILAVDTVPYPYSHTYDILPDSETGAYFAGGALVGSTLKPAARAPSLR